MTDTEAFAAGAAWKKAGKRQAYRYPEDIDGATRKPDPRCHMCGLVAYKAELVTYEQIPFHKECFRCLQCKKKLTAGQANPFGESTFLCNTHAQQAVIGTQSADSNEVYSARTLGYEQPKGSGLVTSTVTTRADVDLSKGASWRANGGKQSYRYPEDLLEKPDPRCQKCGSVAYKAEIHTYEKIPYHKNCFKCLQCRRKMHPGEASPWGEDDFLCTTHFQQAILGTGGGGDGPVYSASSAAVEQKQGPSIVSGDNRANVDLSAGAAWKKKGEKQVYRYPEDVTNGVPDPRCQFCGKKAYPAEMTTYEKIPYHKDCFKCVQCKRKLTPGGANPYGEDAYLCNTHFQQAVLGSKATQGDVTSASTAQAVPTGPAIVSGVTSATSADMSGGLAWRKTGKKQAYEFADDLLTKPDPRCNKCGKTVYKAEMVTYEKIPFHKDCFKCYQCKKKMTAGEANPFGDKDYLCNVHFHQIVFGGTQGASDVVSAETSVDAPKGPSLVFGSSGYQVDQSKMVAGSEWRLSGEKQIYKYPEDLESGSDPRCNFCGKKAYRAELVTYEQLPYHKNCFRCLQCNRRMTAADADPFGEDTYLCHVHYAQATQSRMGLEAPAISAESKSAEDSGPSSVGGALPKKKKTTYKPPRSRRRGKK